MISFNFAKQITDYLFATSNFQLRRRRMTCVLDNINLELKGGKSEYEDENKLVPIQKKRQSRLLFQYLSAGFTSKSCEKAYALRV